ncbi:MAG: hypothetical protein LRY66_01200 [Saccharospirillaceae bacterium]|nr:hypothetical protein [Saccharospirillaceae bacterium]MCD8529988.1 hypothetical protein [Saccharospirillaceae bacterium]
MRRRPSFTLLLLSLALIALGSVHSLAERLSNGGEGQCPLCELAAGPSHWLPPLTVTLPGLLLDLAPQTLMPFLLPTLLQDNRLEPESQESVAA